MMVTPVEGIDPAVVPRLRGHLHVRLGHRAKGVNR